MRAQVYIVEVRGCWKARVTIYPEMDKHFWMNGEFGKAGSLNEVLADSGWLLKEPLPLGDAFRAVELWEAELIRRRGKRAAVDADSIEQGSIAGRCKAIELLLACAEEAKREGLNDGKAGGRRVWWRWGVDVKRQTRWGERACRFGGALGAELGWEGLAERGERGE